MSWDFEILQEGYSLAEGPAWDGQRLLFTDINNSRIMVYDPRVNSFDVWHDDTARTNGLLFDRDGQLYGCSQNRAAVCRYRAGGEFDVLIDSFKGRRLNSPNDMAFDDQNRIWFTDPRYDDLSPPMELDHQSVYRLDPEAGGAYQIERVAFDTTRPNGILVAPDQSELFVSQCGKDDGELRELRAYPILANGSLGQYRVVHNFFPHRGIDGMCWDSSGAIVATAGSIEYADGGRGPGPMIYVIEQSGRILETHPLPLDKPTNCTFGGDDLSDLYVTTGTGALLRAHTHRRGALRFPT